MEPAVSTPAVSASKLRVDAELVRQGFADLPAGLAATVIASLGLAWVTSGSLGTPLAWSWLAYMVAIVLARGATLVFYRRRAHGAGRHQHWNRFFIGGSALSGVGWGYAAWTFYPQLDANALPLLILVIAGITAGATRSLGPNLPACWSFQTLCLLPLILRLLQSDVTIHTIMGALAMLYGLFLLAMAHSYHRSLSNSLRLGFEFVDLAAELHEEKRQVEALNRDLTAEIASRRSVEAELRTAKERAESANLAKSEFLATMSYEIRTPMNGILGMLDLLKTPALTAAQREQLETAAGSADSLLRLLNDILDFARIESGRLDFETVAFRPAAVAEDTLAGLRPRATGKSLDLRFSADAAARTRVMGDAMRFRQILLNLVGNALKAAEHGAIGLELAASESPGGPLHLAVRVREHDTGLDPAARARIARLFCEPDATPERGQRGTGLGLALCRRLIEGMGGRVAAQDETGAGTIFAFSLRLPLSKERNTAIPFATDTVLPQHLDARILVVEDDDVNQRVMTLMLQRLGLQCHIVPDGPSALNAIKAAEWDLVFMDGQLPGIDGLETTRRARLLLGDRELPIVALTANARASNRAACLAAGMDDFLPKPIRIEALQTCLTRWLHHGGS